MRQIFMQLTQAMIKADGTKDKSKLGANAILAVIYCSSKSSRNSTLIFRFTDSSAESRATDFLFL